MAGDSYRDLGGPTAGQRDSWNWVLCIAIAVVSCVMSLWWLLTQEPDFQCNTKVAVLPVLSFNVVVALYFTGVLCSTALDPRPLVIEYVVPGRADIPMVRQSFTGLGRWVAFTLWSNTLGTLYYWVASAVGVLILSHKAVPWQLCVAQQMLWEISLPMSFLINIVVTFALIPMCDKQGKHESLWWMTRWRSLSLHNGFCITSAIECGLATPRAVPGHLPIMVLYGLAYVVFAWCLFHRRGVYLYFFLDPRFKLAPVGFIGLIGLLASLYLLGSQAAAHAAFGPLAWPVRMGLLLIALATCTWRHPNAKEPGQGVPAASGS